MTGTPPPVGAEHAMGRTSVAPSLRLVAAQILDHPFATVRAKIRRLPEGGGTLMAVMVLRACRWIRVGEMTARDRAR